jgi:hypothetical protein
MKRFVMLMLLFGILSPALTQAQEKATLSTYRVFPIPGKDALLKKALMEHAAKFHTGTWKWRVFMVLSGPDEGSYQINEGPNSWTELEGRKDISEEHLRDYEKNVLPLSERTAPASFFVYQKDLSSDSAAGHMKKALLRHTYLKPGKGSRISSYLAIWKKVYDKLGMKVGVWLSFFSGQPQYVTSYRLAEGFVDLEQPWGKKTREAYDEIAGMGAYGRYLEDLDGYVDKTVEEIIEFLPDVSSK